MLLDAELLWDGCLGSIDAGRTVGVRLAPKEHRYNELLTTRVERRLASEQRLARLVGDFLAVSRMGSNSLRKLVQAWSKAPDVLQKRGRADGCLLFTRPQKLCDASVVFNAATVSSTKSRPNRSESRPKSLMRFMTCCWRSSIGCAHVSDITDALLIFLCPTF